MVAFPGAESRYALCNCDHHGYAHLSRKMVPSDEGTTVELFLAVDKQWERPQRGIELGFGPCSMRSCGCVKPVYIATNVNPPAPAPKPTRGEMPLITGAALAALLACASWIGASHGISIWATAAFVLAAFGIGWLSAVAAFSLGAIMEKTKP